MIFRNHLIVTAAVTVVTVEYGGLDLPLWLQICTVFFGSLFPDLDHPGSTIGKRVLFISIPLSAIFGHRQITHSIWPIFGMLILLSKGGVVYNDITLCVAIGYSSHLFADFLTDGGIPFLWPLQYRVKSPIPVETGGIFEYLIAYSLFFGSFYI